MSPRILLTGASGLLGTWLRRTAPTDHAVVSLVHRRTVPGAAVRADLRDADAVSRAVRDVRPDVVVHAAYAKDRDSIVDATAHVAAATAEVGARLVHVSSDAVFAGDGRVRAEDDVPDPVHDYGRHKAEAEAAVRRHVPGAAVVRTSLLTSRDPDDHDIARLRAAAAAATWFVDELRQPVEAHDVARSIWALVALGPDAARGAWHLPGPELLDRHRLAVRAASAAGIDPSTVVAGTTPRDAVRPRDLRLADTRARAVLAWAPGPVHPSAG